jgi:hypothetical protein
MVSAVDFGFYESFAQRMLASRPLGLGRTRAVA